MFKKSKNLIKKISVLNKVFLKEESSLNYNELVDRFIIKVKKN